MASFRVWVGGLFGVLLTQSVLFAEAAGFRHVLFDGKSL